MTNNLTLLYVEDDEIVRENFTEIFKTYFANVLTTDNGNEAIKLYEENKIDVAILDISINGMNGLNVASKIREKDQKTILLIISAYSDKDKLLQAINLKLFGYLVKPVTHMALNEKIQEILKKTNEKSLIALSDNWFYNPLISTLFYADKEVKLTKNEAKIIKILIENKNSYMTACDIQSQVFQEKSIVEKDCNNVVQLLSRLKKKISQKYNEEDYFIENCYGV